MSRGEVTSTEQLLRLAKTAEDDEARWEYVLVLHGQPSREAFEGAVRLCQSGDLRDRCLGADVLGQLGTPLMPFRAESVAVLRPMLRDSEACVVRCAVVALGHLQTPDAVADLMTLRAHPDPEVRHAVAFALMSHDDPRAVGVLVELSRDSDAMVRDWATFALGSLHDADTRDVREALAARLEDPDGDTRIEALVGLASRRDARAVAPLSRALALPQPGHVVVDAARAMGSSDLLPTLLALRDAGWARNEVDRRLLDDAIAACRPVPDLP